jgi:hypothetical protein
MAKIGNSYSGHFVHCDHWEKVSNKGQWPLAKGDTAWAMPLDRLSSKPLVYGCHRTNL